jgi:anti-anti-sigma factor
MAIGRGQAPDGHGAPATSAEATGTEATGAEATGAEYRDDLIRLSCRISADGLPVIAIHGDLDVATADRTVRYVTEVIDRYDGLVSADLSGLDFCDACGLGALIRIASYAQQSGRRLQIARPSRAVTRIMRLTGVDERLLEPALAG